MEWKRTFYSRIQYGIEKERDSNRMQQLPYRKRKLVFYFCKRHVLVNGHYSNILFNRVLLIMIDVYDLYQSFCSTYNLYLGGWFRPNTDFLQKCNDISKELWVKWTGEAEKSQEAKDNLLPFLVSKNMIVSNKGVYGTFQPPKNYGRF